MAVETVAVSTLADRIEWILKHRGITGRELSRRAGLGEVHVGQILSRARKNPDVSVEAKTLEAIARGGVVNLQWLSTGDGSPDLVQHVNDLPWWAEAKSEMMRQHPEVPESAIEEFGGWAAKGHPLLSAIGAGVPAPEAIVQFMSAAGIWRSDGEAPSRPAGKFNPIIQMRHLPWWDATANAAMGMAHGLPNAGGAVSQVGYYTMAELFPHLGRAPTPLELARVAVALDAFANTRVIDNPNVQLGPDGLEFKASPTATAPPAVLPKWIADALGDAFRHLETAQHEDLIALSNALAVSPPTQEFTDHRSTVRAAMFWLHAAARLRHAGRRVTTGAVLAIATRQVFDTLDAVAEQFDTIKHEIDLPSIDLPTISLEGRTAVELKGAAESIESELESAAEDFESEAREALDKFNDAADDIAARLRRFAPIPFAVTYPPGIATFPIDREKALAETIKRRSEKPTEPAEPKPSGKPRRRKK
jgi:transcriptional regulator with XRE-family HTH domain